VATGKYLLLSCPGCQHQFRVPGHLVGKKVACPYCSLALPVRGDAPQSNDQLLGKKVGGCRLTQRLGAGALGLVYQGEDLSTGRVVAVKMLGPKMSSEPAVVKRFMREARLCAQVDHPNVVRVFDCGFDRGLNYLVMELVDGGTLANLMTERGKLPWRESFSIIRDIATALEEAARHNIVHRDIKPANILIAKTGEAKLADLGLAKQFDDDGLSNELTLTMQGMAIGSPTYMSPEQIRNAKDARAPSDIYGLGATWYHLLAGRPIFTGGSSHEVFAKVLREKAPHISSLVPDLPLGVAELVMSMIAKDAAARPQTATELLAELAAVEARPEKNLAQRRSTQSGPAWLIPVIIGTVAVAVIGFTVWILLR
jgi:eukaryotic-like serine/threonine-protein kinase